MTSPLRLFIRSIQQSAPSAHQSATAATARSKLRIMAHPGPVEISIHQKLTEGLKPTYIKIQNDSSKHAHHSAMRAQGGGNGETHFTVILASPDFIGKPAIARHRLVNGLLKDEFEKMGLHALSLRLKTPTEAEKEGLVVE